MFGTRRGLPTWRGGMFLLLAIVLSITSAAAIMPSRTFAAGVATFTATQTIPVPPASSFAGSGGGDGWEVAVGNTEVYNVFHHQGTMTVACHLQTDATACWSPKTITDASANNFATSGHPGLWLDPATGKLYVFGTRTSDATGGVVCIDTVLAPSTANPFCGFTPLTAVGEAPLSGFSAISAPARVGSKWFAFNYVQGVAVTGTRNKLLCFDLSTLAACASQPYTVSFGAGAIQDSNYPPPGVAAIGSQVMVPVTVDAGQQLACFDAASASNCSGSWPVAITSYNSSYGAPFPLLSATGAIIGVCLPTGADPCFSLTGAVVPTPAGMAAAIPGTSGWSGAAFVLGPRVYIPNGSQNEVDCYNASTDATCVNFPKAMPSLSLLYSVNRDPQRPTCVWVNADGGSSQIQNFDAYTGGPCGKGPIRVLGSSFVVPTQLCQPASYTSLEIVTPARSEYTSGVIAFQDNDATQIPGIPDQNIDGTGLVDLAGLDLSTSLGLPQFVITLTGAGTAPTEVTVKLTWNGTDDASCVGPGITKSVTKPNTPGTPNSGPINLPGATPALPVDAQPTYTG